MEKIENPEDKEMCEIDVTEVSLDGEEINELILKLQELKQTKKEITFYLDEDNELLIKYYNGEDEEEGEEAE